MTASAVATNAEASGADSHSTGPQVSKAPLWLQNFLEPVFKIKKRHSTIEVRIYKQLEYLHHTSIIVLCYS